MSYPGPVLINVGRGEAALWCVILSVYCPRHRLRRVLGVTQLYVWQLTTATGQPLCTTEWFCDTAERFK